MAFVKAGKTNIKYLFIAIIIAVFAGGVIIEASKLTQCPFWWPSTQQIGTSQDETADFTSSEVEGVYSESIEEWQTYTNEEYGFQINYPIDWEIVEYGNKVWTFEIYGPDSKDSCVFQGYYKIDEVDLIKEAEDYFPNKTIEIIDPFKFNQYEGVKIKTANSEYVFITNKGFIYIIPLNGSNFCTQILSTFEFIGVGEAANGKTYNIPKDYSPYEAWSLVSLGDTIKFDSGSYDLTNNNELLPALPGGVKIVGNGSGETFLIGTIKVDRSNNGSNEKTVIKDLSIYGLYNHTAITIRKSVELANIIVYSRGAHALWAGWKDVTLDITNSTFINLNSDFSPRGEPPVAISVAGNLSPLADNNISGNTFLNFYTGIAVPTGEYEKFVEEVSKENFFINVDEPFRLEAFG